MNSKYLKVRNEILMFILAAVLFVVFTLYAGLPDWAPTIFGFIYGWFYLGPRLISIFKNE